MMKKIIALLLTLCCLCIAPALAENDVWGLYARIANGEYLLGSAVACGDGMLLSVDGIVVDGMMLYVGRMDERIQVSHAAGLDNGALVVYAEGISGEIPAVSAGNGKTVYVEAVNMDGGISAVGSLTADVMWQERQCMLMTCSAKLTVGAPVMDRQGALVGLIAAVWGEGENNYVVMPADAAIAALHEGIDENSAVIYDGVADVLTGAEEQVQQPEVDEKWIRDFTVEAEGAKITVDWSAANHVPDENEKYFVLYMDLQNPFYSYMEVERDRTDLTFYAAPNRNYAVWVQCAMPETFTSNMDVTAMRWVMTEEAAPFEEYGYRDVALYLGIVPAGSDENSVQAQKLEKITVADIIDPETDFCLQAISQYEVTEETSVMMQTVLTTPEGYAFVMDSSFIFIPEIQEKDVWNASLEMMFANYQKFSGFISAGDYTVAYYFDGQPVGSLTFTIE